MTPFYGVLAAVLAQRLLELAIAAHNTRKLKARGGIEVGRGHYPLFVLLHAAWLLAVAATVAPETRPSPLGLIVLGALMAGRVWVMTSLGPFWTTRIITLDSAPLVRRGPYRFLRHPNYLIVSGEIAVLPLTFGAVGLAVAFSLLNGALLAYRIVIEDRALSARRLTARENSAASG